MKEQNDMPQNTPSDRHQWVLWLLAIVFVWMIFAVSLIKVNDSLDGATGGHSYAPVINPVSTVGPASVNFTYFDRNGNQVKTPPPPPNVNYMYFHSMFSTDAPPSLTNQPPEPPPLPPSRMAEVIQTN
jgi:hypothetical protein